MGKEFSSVGLMASGSFTRPANTTAYAENDGVTDSTTAPSVLEISGFTERGGRMGLTAGWKLTKSGTGVTNANFRLWLYTEEPGTIPNDNAAFSPAVWVDREKLVGYVDFSSMTAGSDGAYAFADNNDNLKNILAELKAGTTLYGILQAKAAYTPASEEQFHVMAFVLG